MLMEGVLHRDIKLGNIFIATDESGQEKVKILDFESLAILGSLIAQIRVLSNPLQRSTNCAVHRSIWRRNRFNSGR